MNMIYHCDHIGQFTIGRVVKQKPLVVGYERIGHVVGFGESRFGGDDIEIIIKVAFSSPKIGVEIIEFVHPSQLILL